MFPITSLFSATLETLSMTFLSGLIACSVGIPWGIFLYLFRPKSITPHPFLYTLLSILVNIMRSIPFIILMIAVIPLTRCLVGTSIGTAAAIVPLSLCAMPFIARIVETALSDIPHGLIEAAVAMGATSQQIVRKVLLPEALFSIIQGITLMLVNLVGYSAMAGAVGGGGLGDLAIRYGYQRFDTTTMLVTITVMILIVQVIQWLGDRFSNTLLKGR